MGGAGVARSFISSSEEKFTGREKVEEVAVGGWPRSFCLLSFL